MTSTDPIPKPETAMATIDHTRTAEIYGPFTQRESRTIAEYERATVAILDSLDAPDSATYHTVAAEHGQQNALELCRLDRQYLAEWAEQVAVLREELHLTSDGLYSEPSKGADLFLDTQTRAYATKKTEVERALLDYLLGAVEL